MQSATQPDTEFGFNLGLERSKRRISSPRLKLDFLDAVGVDYLTIKEKNLESEIETRNVGVARISYRVDQREESRVRD